jgi:hypothetical protein
MRKPDPNNPFSSNDDLIAADSESVTPSSCNLTPTHFLTAYLGKLYGRIPYVRAAEFFNRDGASIARDVLALDQSLRDSKELRSRIDNLARSLTTT